MKLGKVFEGSQRPTSYSMDARASLNMTLSRSHQRDHRHLESEGWMLLLRTVGGSMWQIWEQITKFPTMTKLDLGVDCGLGW